MKGLASFARTNAPSRGGLFLATPDTDAVTGSLHAVEQATPFHIPQGLRKVLECLVLEYGTGGGVGKILPCVRVWTVETPTTVAGYAWVTEHGDLTVPGLHLNLAVLPDHKRSGAGSFALAYVAEVLANEGASELFAQVNSNESGTGKWVRSWLLRRGFEPLRHNVSEPFCHLSNSELARSYPCPLYFRKNLTRTSSGT